MEVVFDRSLKARQREVACARADPAQDYLREAVARRLVGRLGDMENRNFPAALDVGCNTGAVRRALEADAVGGVTSLTQCDASAGVLRECERLAGSEDSSIRLEFAVAEEEALPFEPYSFDVVFSCLALHWVNNLPLAFFNIRHMLRPDGVFLCALLGERTLSELQYAFGAAEEERMGGMGQHCSPSTRLADVGSLAQQAGFSLITVDIDRISVDYSDVLVLLDDLQRMGEQHAPATPTPRVPRDVFLAMAAAYHDLFPSDQARGAVTASFDVIYLIGWAPAETQPKPLDRGSASARFGDVLPTHPVSAPEAPAGTPSPGA